MTGNTLTLNWFDCRHFKNPDYVKTAKERSYMKKIIFEEIQCIIVILNPLWENFY